MQNLHFVKIKLTIYMAFSQHLTLCISNNISIKFTQISGKEFQNSAEKVQFLVQIWKHYFKFLGNTGQTRQIFSQI